MAFDPFTAAFGLGQTILGKIFPDANIKAEQLTSATKEASIIIQQAKEAGHDEAMAEIELLKQQIAVNAIDASSKSFFQAGWRPAAAWSSGIITLFWPIISWCVQFVYPHAPPNPEMLYLGIAGIFCSLAGIRMVEKINGVASGGSSLQQVADAVVKSVRRK